MKRILIIDDEKGIRDIVARILNANGFQSFFAKDGLEGLEQANQVGPDLIVADINMPQLDGVSLCSMLKKNDKTSGIPVLFLTGEGTIGSMESALKEGAAGYLTKPLDASRFLEKVKDLTKDKS